MMVKVRMDNDEEESGDMYVLVPSAVLIMMSLLPRPLLTKTTPNSWSLAFNFVNKSELLICWADSDE
jgi:hypothetical protein